MKKRLISLILVFAMVLSFVPTFRIGASAEDRINVNTHACLDDKNTQDDSVGSVTDLSGGENSRFSATANDGYVFDHWEIEDSSENTTKNAYSSLNGSTDLTVELPYADELNGQWYELYAVFTDAPDVCECDGIVYKSVSAALQVIDDTPDVPATIRLIADVSENVEIADGLTVTIDLNGYVLSGKAVTGETHPVIVNDGNLTVTDGKFGVTEDETAAPHYFRYKATAAWLIDDGATAEAKAAAITVDEIENGKTADDTLIVVYGGVITGGTGLNESHDLRGGGIFSQGKLTVVSGNIIGNNAAYGGAVDVYPKATFNSEAVIEGGLFAGNKSATGTVSTAYPTSYFGKLTVTGGRIVHNYAENACAGINNSAELILGGTAVIKDNDAPFIPNDYSSERITLGTGEPGNGVAPLAEGAEIHITCIDEEYAVAECVLTTNGTADDAAYFHSDDDEYTVKFFAGDSEAAEAEKQVDHLEFVLKPCCEVEGKEFKTIADAIEDIVTNHEGTGTIKMIKNTSENVEIAAGQTITLDLNGYVLSGKEITGKTHSVIVNYGNLTVTDGKFGVTEGENAAPHYLKYKSTDAWVLADDATDEEKAAAITVDEINNATTADDTLIVVYGGVITGGTGTYDVNNYGGAICNEGTLTVNSGNFIGNIADEGGAIFVKATDSTDSYLTIEGGLIAGNRCGSGTVKNSFVDDHFGKMTIVGGKIVHNVAKDGAAGVYNISEMILGGTPVIKDNTAPMFSNLLSYWPFELGTGATGNGVAPLTKGAEVYLTGIDTGFAVAESVLTTNGTEKDTKYIHSDVNGWKVVFVAGDFNAVEENKAVDHLEFIQKVACKIMDGTHAGETYDTIAKAISAAAKNTATTIQLMDDVTENITIPNTKIITLDLNGYVLSGDGTSKVINNKGNLTVTDTRNDAAHYYLYYEQAPWVIHDNAEDDEITNATDLSKIGNETADGDLIKVTGGVITGGFTKAELENVDYGGGIYNNAATAVLDFQLGNVIGNTAIYGGGIFVSRGTGTISGGKIVGNTANNGGGGFSGTNCVDCTLGNVKIERNFASNGGGWYNSGNGPVTMTDTIIRNNRAKAKVAGLYDTKGVVTIKGNTKITDNYIASGREVNIYLPNGKTVTFAEIGQNCSVGVTLENMFGKVADGKFAAYVTSDDFAFAVRDTDEPETTELYKKDIIEIENERHITLCRLSEEKNQKWKIMADIELTRETKLGGFNSLEIDGNNKKFTCAETVKATVTAVSMLNFVESGTNPTLTASIKNLTLVTNDQFRRGITLQSSTEAGGKQVSLTLDGVVIDNTLSKTAGYGVAILNNNASLTMKGACAILTGQKSYTGIELNHTQADASLTFDTGATLRVVDARKTNTKAAYPLISKIADAEDEGYNALATATVTGTDGVKLGSATSATGVEGYGLTTGATVDDVDYSDFYEAVDKLEAEGKITLIGDVTLTKNVTFPDNVTLAFNGYSLTTGDYSITATGLVFDIGSETDARSALAIYAKYRNQTWNIIKGFAIKKSLEFASLSTLTVNGNGYTITGDDSTTENADDLKYLLGFYLAVAKHDVTATINNLTIKTNSKFQRCLFLQSNLNTKKQANVTLNGVTLDNAMSSTEGEGACVVNNAATLTVGDKCKFITGAYSQTAIDINALTGKASLTFETDANVSFTDDRTVAGKVKEPLVGVSKDAGNTNEDALTVTGYEAIKLVYATKAALNPNETEGLRSKDGYDFQVAKIGTVCYSTIEDAAAASKSGDVIDMLASVKLKSAVTFADNVSIRLNSKSIKVTDTTTRIVNTNNLTLLINSETDLKNAKTLSQSNGGGFEVTWKLEKSINVGEMIESLDTFKKVTVDGNGYAINAKNSDAEAQNAVLKFTCKSEGTEKTVEFKNLTVNVKDGFRNGIVVGTTKASAKYMKATFDGVTVKMMQTAAPVIGGKQKDVCPIIVNSANTTVKNALTLTLNAYSWAAIDLDKTFKTASLTFENGASIAVTDARTAAKKAYEPLVGFSEDPVNNSTDWLYDGAEAAGLGKATKAALNPTGDENLRSKDGLDFVAASIAGSTTKYYGSLEDAILAATDATSTTVKVERDLVCAFRIPSTKIITLDLNGHIIDLDDDHAVVSGELTVTDTDDDTTHKGDYAEFVGGLIVGGDATKSAELTGMGGAIIVAKDTVTPKLVISAGTVTGCNAVDGGAVFVAEGAEFEMTGGKIANCTATNSGGGVAVYMGTATVSATIENCVAANYGGGISNRDGTVTVASGADIKKCKATGGSNNDLLGGGVFNDGTLNMTGGVIEQCSADKGAGVHNDGTSKKAVFTMTAGEIKNNSAVRTKLAIKDNLSRSGKVTRPDDIRTTGAVKSKATGGGVQVSANSTFIMTGGKITGNNIDADLCYGAGVYVKGVVKLGGSAVITGNTIAEETASNLHLYTDVKATIGTKTGSSTGNDVLAPTSTMNVGVTTETTPVAGQNVVFTSNGTENDTKYFESDAELFVKFNSTDNVLELASEATFDDRFGGKYSFTGTENDYQKYDELIKGTAYTVHGTTKYTFAGWYDGVDGTGNALSGTPEGGVNYYAKWTNDGKTVVTTELVFDKEIAGEADTAEKYGYAWNATESTLTLSGLTVDMIGRTLETSTYAVDITGGLENNGAKIVVSDGTVNRIFSANSADEMYAMTVGICSHGDLDISGEGNLDIICGNAINCTKAIVADGDMTVAGNLNIDAGTVDEGGFLYAFSAYSVTFTDGSITAKADFADDFGSLFDNCDVYALGAKITANKLAYGTGTGDDILAAVIDPTTGAVTGVDGARFVSITFHTVCPHASVEALAEGKVRLALGKADAGEVELTKIGNGWVIKKDGQNLFFNATTKTVGFSTGKTVWKYDGGLYTEVTSTTTTRYFFWTRTTTTTEKFYLGYGDGKFSLGKTSVKAGVWAEGEHRPAYVIHDDCHDVYCTACNETLEEGTPHTYDGTTHKCVCGKVDPKACMVKSVSVNYTKTVRSSGFWGWRKTTTSYQATITVNAPGAKIAKVEYSGDNRNWTQGKTFTTDLIAKVYVRVTESNGNSSVWLVDGSNCKRVDDK